MKKFLLVGLASAFATILSTSLVEANGRYCLHYPGNPHCVAVLYDQNYGYAPPPPMIYQGGQIIYVAPPRIRYVKRWVYYTQPNFYSGQEYSGGYHSNTNWNYSGGGSTGGSNYNGGNFMGGGYHHGGGHHNGGMGGGKNGGGKNGG